MPRPTARPNGWLASIPTSGWSGSSGTGVSARPPTRASPRLEAVSSSCSTTTPRSPRAGSRRAWPRSPTRPSASVAPLVLVRSDPVASIRRATRTRWPAGRPSAATASPAALFAGSAGRRGLRRQRIECVLPVDGAAPRRRLRSALRLVLRGHRPGLPLALGRLSLRVCPAVLIYHDVSATYDHGSPALQRRMARNAEIVFWANLPARLAGAGDRPAPGVCERCKRPGGSRTWPSASVSARANAMRFVPGRRSRPGASSRAELARKAVAPPHFALGTGSLRDVRNHLKRPAESSSLIQRLR